MVVGRYRWRVGAGVTVVRWDVSRAVSCEHFPSGVGGGQGRVSHSVTLWSAGSAARSLLVLECMCALCLGGLWVLVLSPVTLPCHRACSLLCRDL